MPPMNDTRIRLSRLQNRPEGAFEPPRTGSPWTILPEATLVALASAETQSLVLPAEQFWIKPLLPYTNRYGCSDTIPPDTEMLLLKVSTTVPEAVALLEILSVVVEIDTTVVLAGMPVPVIVWPAPIKGFDAASVMVSLSAVVVPVSVKIPTSDMFKPVMSPINTGVLVSLSIEARFCPG